jgi:hypothetical protein
MLVAAPFAFLGMLLPSNEYRAMGIAGGVDCDGPFQVLLFAVPALAVYLSGFVFFVRRSWRHRNLRNVMATLVCCAICAGLAANATQAVRDHLGNDHRMICSGAGL